MFLLSPWHIPSLYPLPNHQNQMMNSLLAPKFPKNLSHVKAVAENSLFYYLLQYLNKVNIPTNPSYFHPDTQFIVLFKLSPIKTEEVLWYLQSLIILYCATIEFPPLEISLIKQMKIVKRHPRAQTMATSTGLTGTLINFYYPQASLH